MAEVDLRALITLVHDRPILWDSAHESYMNRRKTRLAWIDVFTRLNDSFEELGEQERAEYGKVVKKKWANLRDSFRRSERRHPPKTYVYAQQMQFLKKNTEGRLTANGFSNDADAPQADESCKRENDWSNSNGWLGTESAEEAVTFKSEVREKLQLDPVDAINNESGRHSSFFNGIIPSIETFDDDEIVEFQLKTLQVVSEIKKRKKASRNIYTATHLCTSHLWPSSEPPYDIAITPSISTHQREGEEFPWTGSPLSSCTDVSENSH